jgi:hypothetical protein
MLVQLVMLIIRHHNYQMSFNPFLTIPPFLVIEYYTTKANNNYQNVNAIYLLGCKMQRQDSYDMYDIYIRLFLNTLNVLL